jgi:hypothetical protein
VVDESVPTHGPSVTLFVHAERSGSGSHAKPLNTWNLFACWSVDSGITVNASNCRKYLTLLAERVGFVPVVPSPINGLGQIKSPQTAKSTQKLSIRYKTGTAQLPSFAAGQVQLVCVEEFHRVPD